MASGFDDWRPATMGIDVQDVDYPGTAPSSEGSNIAEYLVWID
jgi:hypothetical protein